MTQNIKIGDTMDDSMWPFTNVEKQRKTAILTVGVGLMLIAFYLISPKYDLFYIIGIPLGTLGLIYFSEALTHASI